MPLLAECSSVFPHQKIRTAITEGYETLGTNSRVRVDLVTEWSMWLLWQLQSSSPTFLFIPTDDIVIVCRQSALFRLNSGRVGVGWVVVGEARKGDRNPKQRNLSVFFKS